ncbi:MAG: MaoC family dehydratase [Flavobacteriales bacterium]|nr:MaoC family dehydratase [Flavobacteriales bacterium]
MLEVGQKAEIVKTFTENEVLSFSEMSMDDNPIHFDKNYASKTRFKKRIVQGPFVASLIGGLIGTKLPGPGSIYLNQNTNFVNPLFIDEEVRVIIEVISIRADKPVIKLSTKAIKSDKTVVIEGEATIYFLQNSINPIL